MLKNQSFNEYKYCRKAKLCRIFDILMNIIYKKVYSKIYTKIYVSTMKKVKLYIEYWKKKFK